MSTMLQFDEEMFQRLEAIHRIPDAIAMRQEVLRVLALRPGERVLDIGSGPGFTTSEMGDAVGPSGWVCGIDLNEPMVAMARARWAAQPWVEFRVEDATRIPFPAGEFDAAVSTQVYEYVHDMTTALAELYRVLRPGGRALILDTDWGSILWHSADPARMERILAAWDEHLADPNLPRTLSPRLKQAGFLLQHQSVFNLFNLEYDANRFSYHLIKLILGFVPGRRGITQEEAEAWAEELRKLGEEGAYFFSRNQYLFLAVKP